MNNLILPDPPDPKAKGLIDHQRLEFDPNSKSGIETLLDTAEGYIVGRLENELLRYKTDAHLLTISPTGGGKGTGLIIPNLLDHPGSAFVIDIRGETVAKTATARRLQGQTVIVLDPFDITKGQWGRDSYNPFDRIPKTTEDRSADDQILRLVNALMFDPSGRMSNEPIWDNATRNLLSGLITLCVRYWRTYRHNLVEILDVLNCTSSEMERFIIELTSIIQNDPQGQKDRQLKSLLKILTESKATTKITDNALVQAQTILAWAGNKSFEGIIEDSTFSFEDMQGGKMTVYLVVPEEYIDNCAIWVRLMLESAVFSLKDVFSSKGISTSQLPQEERVLFLLDELPAFGQLDIVSSGMATLRGRGVNLWLFIQNLAQLDATYGKEKARTIIGNAASVQVFGSNELEELEYFVRLIGEEFFDVQSVTISETKTEGTSKAIGESHTVSNSESVSQAKGTSISYAKGTNTNWSDAFGRTTSKGRTDTKGTNTNESTNTSWNKGESTGEGTTRNRNWLSSTKVSDNKNKGKNKGVGGGKTLGSGENSSIATNVNDGTSTTKTKGGGESETTTEGSNESVTNTIQKGYSDTTSETITTNESTALGRSISVKQERMKIETVRSLREKLSNRNQLLQVRGFHPFFIPRMSYFVKFMEDDRYMFPDMAAIMNIHSFGSLADRLMKVEEARNVDTLFNDLDSPLKVKMHISQWNTNGNFGEKNKEVAMSYRDFLSKDLTDFIDKYQVLEEGLREQRESFNEIAVVCLAFISAMQNLGMQDFMDADEYLIARMIEIEERSRQKIDLSGMFQKYRGLPLANMTDSSFAENVEQEYYWETHYETMVWLAHTYSPTVSKVIHQFDLTTEKLKQFIAIQEDMRGWLENSVEKITSRIDEAIGIAMEREMRVKHEFFMKRNLIE